MPILSNNVEIMKTVVVNLIFNNTNTTTQSSTTNTDVFVEFNADEMIVDNITYYDADNLAGNVKIFNLYSNVVNNTLCTFTTGNGSPIVNNNVANPVTYQIGQPCPYGTLILKTPFQILQPVMKFVNFSLIPANATAINNVATFNITVALTLVFLKYKK
jgi:hypothetical protein